ncbi:hypothetical protein GGU10DRAFT_31773 [Lentinula aff. detonsa]|uniref:Uncharacterized protein n=1 Tax=Lentinula aff. detonsa TaxID=2804958 RepID=A0AA38NRA3_9AGAR|nr:hypothetical protein GGU10DRAFT_31773 [Lentinula aff. detonsa]
MGSIGTTTCRELETHKPSLSPTLATCTLLKGSIKAILVVIPLIAAKFNSRFSVNCAVIRIRYHITLAERIVIFRKMRHEAIHDARLDSVVNVRSRSILSIAVSLKDSQASPEARVCLHNEVCNLRTTVSYKTVATRPVTYGVPLAFLDRNKAQRTGYSACEACEAFVMGEGSAFTQACRFRLVLHIVMFVAHLSCSCRLENLRA